MPIDRIQIIQGDNKMKKHLKLASLIVGLCLLLVMPLSTSANNADSMNAPIFKISNCKIDNNSKIVRNIKNIDKYFKKAKVKNTSDMKIDINLKELDELEANKPCTFESVIKLKIESETYNVNATGELIPIKLSNNDTVYLGSLQGYIDGVEKDENSIVLALHYMPTKNQQLITCCIGVKDDVGNEPTILAFGEWFKEIDEAILTRDSIAKEDESGDGRDLRTANDINSLKMPMSMVASTLSSNDYYPTFKDKSYVSTPYGPIVTTCFYAPILSSKGKLTDLYGKVGGHKSNMTNYATNSLGYDNVYNVFVKKAKVKLVSADDYFRLATGIGYYPQASETNISLSIPLFLGQSIPMNFTVSSTNVTLSPRYCQ